jgi:alpha-ketoglutarate-dependent taurine dioxygenase
MTTVSTRQAFDIRKVTPVLGAEVRGIDLAGPLDDQDIARLRGALLAHRVLFFRGQRLDHASHVALGARFGELTRAHPYDGAAPEVHPEIFALDHQKRVAEARRTSQNLKPMRFGTFPGWHCDVTPAVNPPAASILRAEVIPQIGGDTQWTNLIAAYESLSEPLRRFVDGLRAEHCFELGYSDVTGRMAANRLVSHHPVVRVHPETGERALYVSPGFTSHIVGMHPNESTALLQLLFEQITRPEHIVRLKWEPGTVAFWDNRSTAHLAPLDVPDDQERRLYRVTLVGDVPVGPDGSPSTSISGEPLGGARTKRAADSPN